LFNARIFAVFKAISLPRYAKTLTLFIIPQNIKSAGEAKIKTKKKIIIKGIKKIIKTGTDADAREINNKIRLTANITSKKNVTAAANAVITEKKPGNVKTKNVKTKTELFKTKVIIRLRRYLILSLIDFYSRKPKIIKFVKILLRIRWAAPARAAIK